MLVLSRKNQEKIKIGEEIEITIVEVRGNSVRLGIKAPKEVPITREKPEKSTTQSVDKLAVAE